MVPAPRQELAVVAVGGIWLVLLVAGRISCTLDKF